MTPGILLNAIFFLGMAVGRVASLLVERTGKWPIVFLVLATALAGVLVRDLRLAEGMLVCVGCSA